MTCECYHANTRWAVVGGAMCHCDGDQTHCDLYPSISAENTRLKRKVQNLLNERTAQPDSQPKECPAMERVEGGIPYCSDKQTACDGCHSAQPEHIGGVTEMMPLPEPPKEAQK